MSQVLVDTLVKEFSEFMLEGLMNKVFSQNGYQKIKQNSLSATCIYKSITRVSESQTSTNVNNKVKANMYITSLGMGQYYNSLRVRLCKEEDDGL